MAKGKNKCFSCGQKHSIKFPKDFPNRWKFCCSCRFIAVEIIKIGIDHMYNVYEGYYREGIISRHRLKSNIDNAERLSELIKIA